MVYHNRTPYNSFDAVLHADFAEPRVHLIYTLNARYLVLDQKQYDGAAGRQSQAKSTRE